MPKLGKLDIVKQLYLLRPAQGQTVNTKQLGGDCTGIKRELDASEGKVEVRAKPIC